MAALGSKKRPICVRVATKEQLNFVAEHCKQFGFEFIAELASDAPPDFAEMEQALAELQQRSAPRSPRVGRNDPCPCGTGRKSKKCCASPVAAS
jgi:uncharacterized protein YecA (UPF0149 family)